MANNLNEQSTNPVKDNGGEGTSDCPGKIAENKSDSTIGADDTVDPTSPATPSHQNKTPSFQITSVFVSGNPRLSNGGGNDSGDELDESDTSDISVDVSRITDAEESSYCADDSLSRDTTCSNLSDRTITSVPVIPTSSQYGLAIVGSLGENCADDSSLIKAAMACADDISTCNASVTVTDTGSVINIIDSPKNDVETSDNPPTHTSRNERFRVVKIESAQPFKCGRWVCMDYLDHNILNVKKAQLDVINGIKELESDSSTGTVTSNFVFPDSSVTPTDSYLLQNDEKDNAPDVKAPLPDNQFSGQQVSANFNVDISDFPTTILSPDQSMQKQVQVPLVTSTQNSFVSQQQEMTQPPIQPMPPHYQQQMFGQLQQNNSNNQQQFPYELSQQLPASQTSQFTSPNQHQGNPETQQSTGGTQQANQQTKHVPQQGSLHDSQLLNQCQFGAYPSQINPQSKEVQQLQNAILIQQVLQSQNVQMHPFAQTPVSVQGVANPLLTESAQNLPSQQLQQLLGVIVQQMEQQDSVQRQHLLQQAMQQLQYHQQSVRQYGGQEKLLGVENPLANMDVGLENVTNSQPVASTNPMVLHNSTSDRSQNVQLPQIQQQQIQQHLQQQRLQQQQLHQQLQQLQQQQPVQQQHQYQQQLQLQQQQQIGLVSHSMLQQSVAKQNDQYSSQLQYSGQQQFPMQQQFQQFPMQQVPLVQLFPNCQQQPVPSPLRGHQLQQQVPSQPHQHLPTSISGTFPRTIPVGDSRSAPNLSQGFNRSQSGQSQVLRSHRNPSLQQNYVHRAMLSTSQSEFFAPTASLPERQATSSRSTNTLQTLQQQSLDRLVSRSASFFDMASATQEQGSNACAIDNKIELAMDLVKSHLLFAVREEVEVLKEKISELMERIAHLEEENNILRNHATAEVLAMVNSLPQHSDKSLNQPQQGPSKDPSQ